jgi:hypothetical protein
MPAHHIAFEAPFERTPIHPDGHHERSAMSDSIPGLGDTSGYQIRTQGHLGERLADWFEGFDLRHEADGTTLIWCPALDQAALHGLLAKVRDLGLPLISVTRSGSERDAQDAQPDLNSHDS